MKISQDVAAQIAQRRALRAKYGDSIYNVPLSIINEGKADSFLQEQQDANDAMAKQEAEAKAIADALNKERIAALQPRAVVRQGTKGFEVVNESAESYTRFLEAHKKKADYNLEAFSLVDAAMAAFDPKKAEKLKQATDYKNAVDSRLASVLAPTDKQFDRSTYDATADQLKAVQATVYDIGATVGDWMSPDTTGLEDKGIKPSHFMATEATEKALDLLGKGRDFVAETAGMNKESSDILKLFYNTEGAKEVVSSKLAAVRNLQVKENQRRAKEGLPSIEEENAAKLGNRYAAFAREEADKVRQDKTLASKVEDVRTGMAIKKGMAGVVDYAIEKPWRIPEVAVESAPYLVAGGPVGSTLRALGFSASASTMGTAAAVGALDTVQGAAQAKEATKAVDMADLAKSQAFQQLKAANPDATPEQLREVLAMSAEYRALGVGLAANTLLAVVSTKLGLNPVEAAISGNAKKVTALGAVGAMAREGIGEFPEEGLQQWSQNVGEIAGGVRDPSKEWENVVGAGTLGAFAGVATSGGVSVGSVAIDTGAKLSARNKIIRAEEQAAQTGAATPTAQTQPGATTTEQVKDTAPIQDDQRDPTDKLVPVSFFESRLDDIIAQQDDLVPEGSEQRRVFSNNVKQEYRNYLENGTPMSQGTADLVASFVPAYKEVSAPRPQEEVDAGLNQLVSDVFSLSQDTNGQSLGSVNTRIMERISGETSYQVLEKFAELQATKAANAGNTRAGRVFSAEANAANARAQQLKNQYQMPVVPTAQQQAPEVSEVITTPDTVETPSTSNIEPPAFFTDRLEEMDRIEQERAPQEAPAEIPDGKFGSGIVYRTNLEETTPITSEKETVQEVAPERKVSEPVETPAPAVMSPDETAVEIGNQVRDIIARRSYVSQALQNFIWRFIVNNPEQGVRLAKEFIGNDEGGVFGSPIFQLAMPNDRSKGYQPAIDLLHRLSQSDAKTALWARRGLERSNLSGLLNKPAPPESSVSTEQQDSDTLQSATGATQSVPESTSRRKFIMGFAAAAATAAATGAAPSGTFSDDVTLGEAKALTEGVLLQKVSTAAETVLRGKDGANQDGAARIKGALREIVANGPVEVRELAKKILSLMPTTGILLEVDDVSTSNAHGAVELLPSPKLTLFTFDGREGLTLKTFLHESLHVAVASRYVSLGVGSIRENDSKLGSGTPEASNAIEAFITLWEEFKESLTSEQRRDTSNTSIHQAANDPDEFFVRSLTDPNFQKYLASVEYKGKTLFDKFKDWVKTNLFGFKKGTAPSWLDAALVASNKLSDAMAKDVSDFARVDVLRKKEGLQSATSATDGSVTSPKPTAKKFKDMSLFEQWAIVTQLRDTTSAAEFDSILAGIASGGIMLRNDPTTSTEGVIDRKSKVFIINLAQFTGENIKRRRTEAKELRKKANASLTFKDRLSRKAKKEKLQAFYLTNFAAFVQSSTSFVDAVRHELTHAKDLMSRVDMEAVNEMMANNPLWRASAEYVEANPSTKNKSREDKLLETNGYYMTALSAMASNPQYAPLLATFEESVYKPMKELVAFATSDELLEHWASVLDGNFSRGDTLQSATGRTLTLPQANRNQRLKALLEQKITSTELPKGPLKAEAVVDTSPGKPDRTKSVGLQLGMLLDAKDAVEGKTRSEAVAALRALRDSEDVAEPHEANILAGIAEDNYASRLIMDATLGMTAEAKLDYTMLLSDLFSDRDIALSTIMSLPVYTTEPTKDNLQPLWANTNALRGRLLGAVGGAASVAEMGEAYRSDIKVSDEENNNPNVEPVSLGSVISGIKDGMLLNGTDGALVAAAKSVVAAARAKIAQYETVTIARSKKHASAKISTLSRAINGNLKKLRATEAAIQELAPLEAKLDKFLAGLKKEPKQLSGVFGKLNKLTALREEKQRILDDIKEQKADLEAFKNIEDALSSIIPGTKITAELVDVMIQAHRSAKLSEQKATYEFKNAVVLEDAGQTAVDGGEGAINSFLNSTYMTVSNQKQGVEGARMFVSPEEAATNKKIVEVDGKYYDLLKVVDSMIEADGLKYNKVKPQVYIRYLYDSMLAISIANNNAPVLPTYVSAMGRQLHALIVEYTEVVTDGGIVEKEKIRVPKQVIRNDDATGKPYKDYKFSVYGYIIDPDTSDLANDPAFLQMYKNAVEGSVAQARFSSPSGTTVFSLAEEKGTNLKSLDDVLTDELQELENLNDDIEALLFLFEGKDYEAEYDAFFGENEDGTLSSTEAEREASWWSQAGTMIAFNPGIAELLHPYVPTPRPRRRKDGTVAVIAPKAVEEDPVASYLGTEADNYESIVSALQNLSDLREDLENKMELARYQNEIVRQMGYDFDSGNLAESYDFDMAEGGFTAATNVGNPRMGEYRYKYDPTDGVWKKTEEIITTEGKESDGDAKAVRSERLARAAKAARVKAVDSLIKPTSSESNRESRIARLTETFTSNSVIKRELLEEYLAKEEAAMEKDDFSYVSNSRYYSKSTPVYRQLGETKLYPASWSKDRVRDRASEIEAWEQGFARQEAMIAAEKEEAVKYEDAGVNKYGWKVIRERRTDEDGQGQLFSATGSFSGIFRNIRTRVAADDVNALTAMIADRATLSAIKTGAQNNAFIGPFTRNFVNRGIHSAISMFKLRVDGLMAKNTAVIGGKVARLNQEMDNLGISQKERTALLNLLVTLDETYTVQAIKAISKTALINKYKKIYGDGIQTVFDMADELRQEVDMAIEKLAKATLGQYTYDTAPKKVKDAYDALIASKQRYLHRTYHKFSISSGRLWKAQIDNAIEAIKKGGPTVAANSSSHSAKAHAAVLNAAYTVVKSWNAFTERGTPIEHAFKQVAPGWKTMNDEVKLRLVLDMFQEDFMAAAELEITNGSINSLSPASKNAGALKAKRLDGPQNKVFRELLGENRDYGRVISETIENQTAITMHLEMMRQLQHMGLLVDKNTYDKMSVAQRELYTTVPSAGIFSAFSSSYILKDYEYAVTMPMPKVSIAKSIRDFNQAIKKGAPLEAGMAAIGGTYTAIATTFGLLKMFTVFTSPNLWASLGVGSLSFAAKSAAYPNQLADAYKIVSMWKNNQAGAPIDKNDPLYDKYMFVMGTETIDSAVWAEMTTRAKDSDYEAALAQLDTNGRLVRDMGFKTVEDIKDYLIATWTKYEAVPKVAAALAHRENLNKYNKALGKKEVSPAFVGNIVRREFPSAKDVPELAKLSDSIGVTMFAGFYYQTIKAGSWGIAQNLNEGLKMYREAGDNSTAKEESVKFTARIIAGSVMQFATIVGLTYLLRALFTMDDDDMDEEQRKLKKAAEATLYTTENPDNLMHIGFHEDGTPLFVDVTMMVNPLDVRDTLFRRAFDAMSDDNKETLSEVLFDQIPYGFVGQTIKNYMRGMEPDKNATKVYDRLANAGILRYINNLNEYGVAPGEAGTIAGALANISGIKKVDPSDRLAQMGNQVFFANKDLANRVKDVIYDGDSYNKPQMRDQVEDELDYVGMKARVYFDATNDAFKRSGMSKSEFISAMTKSLPETKAKMFAKDLNIALVDKGENYAEERAAYSAKQIVSYYNKEVKKGLLATDKKSPLYNASTYDVAAATRNKTSYEAIIDPTTPDKPVKATVTGVHDADTIYVTTNSGASLKVRIQNIDAFELKQKLRDGSLDIGREGQQYLSSLINKKQVTLFGYGYDNNGRMIARVLTKDGRDAGTIVAEEGYAIMTDISELEDYPTKAEKMDAVAPSVYRERNK